MTRDYWRDFGWFGLGASFAVCGYVMFSSPVRSGTLDDFLKSVASDSSATEAIKADIAAELARGGSAAASARPSLEVLYTARNFQDSSLPRPRLQPQGRPGAAFSWSAIDWGANAARVDSEGHSIRAGIERQRRKLNDLLGEAATNYLSVWNAAAKERAFLEGVACVGDINGIAAERKRQQIATEAQLRSVESEAMLIRIELADARGEIAKARAALGRWSIYPVAIGRAPPTARPATWVMIRGYVSAPEIYLAEIERQKAAADIRAATRAQLPTIDAVSDWTHTAGEKYSDLSIGARVRVDLFDQAGNAVRVRIARAELEAATKRREAANFAILSRMEVTDTVERTSREAIATAEAAIALELLRMSDARQAFLAGRGEPMQIAQACRRIATASRAKIEAISKNLTAIIAKRIDLGDLP